MLRTYSIVDLDLACEHHGRHKRRESEMLDEHRVRQLDKRATSWIKNGREPAAPRLAEVINIAEVRDRVEREPVELAEAA